MPIFLNGAVKDYALELSYHDESHEYGTDPFDADIEEAFGSENGA